MDAIVLHGVSDLRYEQVPVPAVETGKVRVQQNSQNARAPKGKLAIGHVQLTLSAHIG